MRVGIVNPEEGFFPGEFIDKPDRTCIHFFGGFVPEIRRVIFDIFIEAFIQPEFCIQNAERNDRSRLISLAFQYFGKRRVGNVLPLRVIVYFHGIRGEGIEHSRMGGEGDGNHRVSILEKCAGRGQFCKIRRGRFFGKRIVDMISSCGIERNEENILGTWILEDAAAQNGEAQQGKNNGKEYISSSRENESHFFVMYSL